MVVRACVTLDNLDQVGELGFGQRVLLNQPSLEFEPDQSQACYFRAFCLLGRTESSVGAKAHAEPIQAA
jgi:hypothetical protein